MKPKTDLRINCDNFSECKNKALFNLQTGSILWKCLKNGRYIIDEPFASDDYTNEHLCLECAKLEGWKN